MFNSVSFDHNNKITINCSNSKIDKSRSNEKLSFPNILNNNSGNNYTFNNLPNLGLNFIENKNNSEKIEVEENQGNDIVNNDGDIDMEDGIDYITNSNKVFETIVEEPENENEPDKEEKK